MGLPNVDNIVDRTMRRKNDAYAIGIYKLQFAPVKC